MKEWILNCNREYFDLEKALENGNSITWPQGEKVNLGDIVFIYSEYQERVMLCKCVVEKTDIYHMDTFSKSYVKHAEFYQTNQVYMKLKVAQIYEEGFLSNEIIKRQGLAILGGICEISPELSAFLNKNEKSKNSKMNSKQKKVLLSCLLIVVLGILGFFFIHIDSEPTCTEPAKCYICGRIGERALGHLVDSTTGTTCEICGLEVKEESNSTAAAVIITQQPRNVAAKEGETVTIYVEATGDDLTYTWWLSDKEDTKYYESSIASPVYKVVMNEERNGRSIYCVVTDKYGNSVTSQTVKMLIGKIVEIKEQPKDVEAKIGETAVVSIVATGDDLTYEWWVKNVDSEKYFKSSSEEPEYKVKVKEEHNGRQVYCVVRDKYGNIATSKNIKISCK